MVTLIICQQLRQISVQCFRHCDKGQSTLTIFNYYSQNGPYFSYLRFWVKILYRLFIDSIILLIFFYFIILFVRNMRKNSFEIFWNYICYYHKEIWSILSEVVNCFMLWFTIFLKLWVWKKMNYETWSYVLLNDLYNVSTVRIKLAT